MTSVHLTIINNPQPLAARRTPSVLPTGRASSSAAVLATIMDTSVCGRSVLHGASFESFIYVLHYDIDYQCTWIFLLSEECFIFIVNRGSFQPSRCSGLLGRPRLWSPSCCGSHRDARPSRSDAELPPLDLLTVLKGKMLTQCLRRPQAGFRHYVLFCFTPLWGSYILTGDWLFSVQF